MLARVNKNDVRKDGPNVLLVDRLVDANKFEQAQSAFLNVVSHDVYSIDGLQSIKDFVVARNFAPKNCDKEIAVAAGWINEGLAFAPNFLRQLIKHLLNKTGRGKNLCCLFGSFFSAFFDWLSHSVYFGFRSVALKSDELFPEILAESTKNRRINFQFTHGN